MQAGTTRGFEAVGRLCGRRVARKGAPAELHDRGPENGHVVGDAGVSATDRNVAAASAGDAKTPELTEPRPPGREAAAPIRLLALWILFGLIALVAASVHVFGCAACEPCRVPGLAGPEHWPGCITGPGRHVCLTLDLDHDQDVDLYDYHLWLLKGEAEGFPAIWTGSASEGGLRVFPR